MNIVNCAYASKVKNAFCPSEKNEIDTDGAVTIF